MMLGDLPILPLPAPPTDGNLGPLPLSQLPVTSGQDNQENDNNNNSQQNSSTDPAPVATHTRTIGIIHPPPDIRTIVDKTAQFVAKNGNEFERRIIGNNAGNAKFNFLNGSDPYHAYYQHRLSEFRAQAQLPQPGGGAAAAQPTTDSALITGDATQVAPEGEMVARVEPSAMFRPVKKVIEPPEREIYTVRLPEGITGEELDIIRLTAQFVARNGKSFLTGLTSREINNPQFHFLKPTHSMFTFFTKLADVYSLVLMPPKGLTDKLSKSVVDMTTVLERCFNRLEWDRSEAQARQKMEDEVEQEKIEWQSIDWHDFVVVETIEFVDDEDDELPPPMTLEEVIRRSKVTSAMEEDEVVVEPGKEADMEMDEEEVQLVEEGMKAASLDENDVDKKNNQSKLSGPPDEPEAPIRIVKNWKRPEERLAAEKDPTKFVVSPITGELIPISEMAEHMRISLIDPKYKEQKERMMAKIRETTLAQDDEISRNIVGLARTRPDIFGTTEEEVSNAVKAEIEKKKEEQPKQVIWDGHTGSIGRTANQAISQNLNGEDQNDSSLPGPAAPPPRPGLPSIRPLPPPPGLALNMPRMLPNGMQYSVPTSGGMQYTTPTSSGMLILPPPRPPMISINPPLRPPHPPMPMNPQQPQMMNRPPPPPQISVNPLVPPPPGSQFTPLPGTRSFASLPMSAPPMPMIPPPPLPQGMPPPPPEEAPPPLPEEPEPKRAKTDDCIPEEMFLAQHPGPARIVVSVPNVDEGNLKGQLLEITVQSLSETVGNLKEKIAGEVQLPANKQKLSGRVGFLKDTQSLAACNIAPGETLTLSLRERGGRKR